MTALPGAAPVSEKALLETIREAAAWANWACYHTHDSRRSEPGFPDLVLVRDGEMLAWELKSESGRVTAEQQQWLDRFAAVPGVEAAVVRPADLDWALARLTRRSG